MIRRFERLGSTQAEARRLADSGARAGTVVWALTQSAGKGRLGRRWRSPRGGLWATVLLRPRCAPRRLGAFSLAFGQEAARTLARLGRVQTAVKPPNDVLALCADGRWRKLCGILCEASGGAQRLDWLLVGFGVNVDNQPPLKRATSLRALTGRRTGVRPALRAMLRALARAQSALGPLPRAAADHRP